MNSVGQKSSEDGAGTDVGNKLWERPWSTNEMRQNAQNWNLAADSGLLKHLQQFSQTVLSRTHATEKALDSLIEDINVTATNINNINNGFLCLANTQFVENRVYDDDDKETPQDAPCAEKQSREETEAAMLKRVREALSMSVAVLDTMFEPVELQASDSEGEMEDDLTSGSTLLLEPHNPYYHRQLPHIIGTDAFMSDDRIGLGDSPSDSEEQPIDECLPIDIDASSDSDFDAIIPRNKRGMETGSFQDSESYISDEQSGSGQKKQKKASAPPQTSNPTTVDSMDKPGAEAGSGAFGTDNSFAAQLAAKLGGVAAAAAAASAAASQSTNQVPPQKTKQTAPVTKSMEKSDDLFGHLSSDGEDDELFSGQHGLFSSRPKLFDDLEDVSNSLWGATPHADGQSVPTVSATLPTPKSKQSKGKAVDDLFGSSPQDEDDLFSNKPTKSSVTVATPIQGVRPKISSRPTLSVGELDPGIATSTPENALHGMNESGGLFDDASQRSGDISKINEKVQNAGKAVGSNADHPAGSSETQKKKPTGGVLMFGPASGGLKDKLPPRPQSSSSSSSEGEDKLSTSHSSNASPNLIASSTIVSRGSSGLGDSQSNVTSIPSQVDSGAFQPIHTSTLLRVPPDDDGYQTKNVFSSQQSNAFGEDVDDLFSTTSDNIGSKSQNNTSRISGSLFAGLEDDDDDDLFSEVASSKSRFTSGKTSNLIISNPGAVAEKSDDLLSDSRMKHNTNVSNKDSKTEVDGGFSVSIASKEKQETQSSLISKDHNASHDSSDLMNSKSVSNVASFPEMPKLDLFSKDPPPIKTEKKAKKPLSLFDESDSGEDELLFSSASSAGSRRSQASGDLLAFPASTSSEKKPLSKRGLFDDDDALFGSARNDPDVDIFSETAKSSLPAKYTPLHQEVENRLPPNDPQMSNTSQNKSSHVSKPGTGLPSKQEVKDLPAPYLSDNPSLGSSTHSKPPTTIDSLFDDTDDDLFSSRLKSSLMTKGTPTSRLPEDLFVDSVGEGQSAETLSSTQGVSQVNPADSTLSISHSSLYSDENLVSEPKLSKLPTTKSVYSQPSTAPDIAPLPNNSLHDEKEDLPTAHRPEKIDSVLTNKKGQETPPFLVSHTQPRKVQPPKTLDIRKTTDPSLRDYDDDDDDDDRLFKSVVPKSGKDVTFKQNSVKGLGLQSVLNIDPRALLPGAKPPLKKSTLDDHSRQEQVVANVSSSHQIKSKISTSVKEENSEHTVGFDQPIANNSTLPSAVKDRVKLGVKRRPPSNKARREAARASQILDNSDTDNSPFSSEGVDTTLSKKGVADSHLSPASNILSPSTDEDDLFGVPQDLPAEYGKQHVPSSDIFSDAPVLSPTVPDKGNNLFPAKVDNLFPSVKKPSTSEACSTESAEKHDFLNEPVSNTALKGNAVFQKEHINSVSSETHSKVDNSSPENTLFDSSEISSKPARELYPPEHPPAAAQEKVEDVFSGSERSQGLSSSASVENSLTYSTSETSLPQKVENLPPEHLHVEPLNADSSDKLLETQSSSSSDSNEKHLPDKESKKGLFANIQPVDTDPLKSTDTSTSPSISPEGEKMFQNPEDASHSSLFAFVKKKPDTKPQPLFSKAPVLPTKENNSSKTKIGILADDEEDDDDLFSSTKTIPIKKVDSRRKEASHGNTWHLSDDDDDDLFQSTKSAKLPPSHDSSASKNVNLSQAQNKKSLVSSETKTVSSKTMTSGGLFGDENEDDDDLFSQPSSFMKDKLKQSTSNKAPLFSGNNDNLFSSTSSSELSSSTKPKGAASNQNKLPTSSGIRSIKQAGTKLKPENVFDDPLIAMQKNRDA